MAIKRLSFVRGDSQVYNVCFKNSAGVAYNIKNWVVKFCLKTHYNLPDSEASLIKTITTFPDTTSGTCGSAQISIDPADTVNLDPGEYDFDIQVTTSSSQTYTVMRGKLDLGWDVTRTPGTAGTAA